MTNNNDNYVTINAQDVQSDLQTRMTHAPSRSYMYYPYPLGSEMTLNGNSNKGYFLGITPGPGGNLKNGVCHVAYENENGTFDARCSVMSDITSVKIDKELDVARKKDAVSMQSGANHKFYLYPNESRIDGRVVVDEDKSERYQRESALVSMCDSRSVDRCAEANKMLQSMGLDKDCDDNYDYDDYEV